MNNLIKKFITILLIILIFFLISELILRGYYAFTDKTPPFYDLSKRNQYQWFQKNQKIDQSKSLFMYDSIIGWKLKPNIRTETLNSNSKGVRGLKEYDYQRKQGFKRIVMVGDSYTFGQGSNDTSCFPSMLESRLKNTEVINLGLAGAGVDQMYLYFIEEGIKYNPNLLMVNIFEDDPSRNVLTFQGGFAKPVLNHDLVSQKVPPPEIIMEKGKPFLWSYTFNSLRNIVSDTNKKNEKKGLEITQKILLKLKDQTIKKDIGLLVVLIPHTKSSGEIKEVIPLLAKFMKENNINYLDLDQEKMKEIQEKYHVPFYSDHFTHNGNYYTVARILSKLMGMNFIKESEIINYDIPDVTQS